MFVLVELDNYRFIWVYSFRVDKRFKLLWCTVAECRVTCDAHTRSQLVYWWIYYHPFHKPTSYTSYETAPIHGGRCIKQRDSTPSWSIYPIHIHQHWSISV